MLLSRDREEYLVHVGVSGMPLASVAQSLALGQATSRNRGTICANLSACVALSVRICNTDNEWYNK